jgi:FtsP/CotA-like multicopper oxidase with cupredoxin domain
MSQMNTTKSISIAQLIPVVMVVVVLLLTATAHAAAPGIKSTSNAFSLTAQPAFISQPDGSMVYSWGYGCASASGITFAPAMTNNNCPSMQVPGPTLIVTAGQQFTVTLTNNLPAAAGNTSILFPGLRLVGTPSGGAPGVLTQEATHASAVTYSLVADTPGTRAYYSGTQGDLQVEMGLYGTIIALPSGTVSGCPHHNGRAEQATETDYRLATAAYNNSASCYDREYLFQFSEIDPKIHRQAEQQASIPCTNTAGCMQVVTEPYVPAYFMINGRSMPDDMDPNYAPQYPHQPYNGNPHMHPGELVLLRIVGTGRWQHPFHEHGNHVRILARDGNLILAQGSTPPSGPVAGPLLFTTTTTPGLAMDGIFYWTGKGLNWDVFGHHDTTGPASATCNPDANGYYTNASGAPDTAPNYYEWCQDHNKALEANPFGDVGRDGPVTLPDANILANGAWYGGTPYLGPDAASRANSQAVKIPPSGTIANDPTSEAGFAFMWHSHNEREITTNNIFPGGMMMMMLVDPRAYKIDESN